MFDGIGFPSLERYPNTFFSDQIAHLEQALIESPVTSIGGKVISLTRNFDETLQGKLCNWMKGHTQWKTYVEMAEYMGKSKKQIRKYISELDAKGILCERRMNKNVMQIRIT